MVDWYLKLNLESQRLAPPESRFIPERKRVPVGDGEAF